MEPVPERWGGLFETRASAGRLAEQAGGFRAQMGLTTDGPIVMSGHQAGFWHPGIVAKYAAVGRDAVGAATAWLVADLDDNQPTRVRVARRDERGVVQSVERDLAAGAAGHPDAPTGFRPVAPVTNKPAEELARAAAAMRGQGGRASSLAAQVHEAAAGLLEELGAARPDAAVYATDISGTDLFAAVLAEMSRDPQSCVERYNDAVREQPEAGVRMLTAREGRWELPVWRVGPNEPRVPVMVSGGERLEPARHAPRGLLMTGLMRAAGCDLFIHGTGGGVYDRITERWLGEWLGMTLAPLVVVSATLRLDLGFGGMTPGEAQRAIARAHRAAHDPALLGAPALGARKWELVERIAGLERGDAARRRLFGEMHELIGTARRNGAVRLGALEAERERGLAVLRSREAVEDRTWSFLLHDDAALRALIERVRGGVGVFQAARGMNE